MTRITLQNLISSAANIDWDKVPEPLMTAGRKALAAELAKYAAEREQRQQADAMMFSSIANLDDIDRFLDALIVSMREELNGLTSQELAMITEQSGGGVLAITYRSLAAETLRGRLS